MRPGAIHWIIAVFCSTIFAAPVVAQDAGVTSYAVSPASNPSDDAAPPDDKPLTLEESAALSKALTFDPATLADSKPVKSLQLPGLSDPDKFDVSHTDQPDGSSTLTLKRPLATTEWDAKVGADLNLAGTPSIDNQPNKPLPLLTGSQDTSAAWASVGVPNFASFDARVDPTSDQGKIGTTFKQSIPVGSRFSVTLQNTYSVTENFTSPAQTTPTDIPMMAAPVAGPPAPQVWGNEKTVKFDLLTTGTTFGAGVTTASNDPVTHNTFSADQKLYGPLYVTTAVTDLGQPTASKSLSAGFKLNW